MNKYIAIIVGLIVVLVALLPQGREWVGTHFALKPQGASVATSTPLKLGLSLPVLTFDNLGATPVGIEAWNTFQKYLAAAKAHDLPGLTNLSYQLSEACKTAQADTSKTAPCYELMDSVVFFTQGFKQSDFTRVATDAKQVILATDYLKLDPKEDPVKTVLYFVRDPSLKLLGIRFCLGEEGETDECVETSPEKRDLNHNGWWDDVEELFKK